MVKQREVAEAFASGDVKGEASNLYIDGNKIFSYGEHYCIALRLNDNTALFNEDGYSPSTERHKNYVKAYLEQWGYEIYPVSTKEL